MSENAVFEVRPNDADKKPAHTASLVLGILSMVFAFFIPLAGEILGIVGITKASNNRHTHSTTAGLVCSIVGLVLAVVNHILGIILQFSAMA